MAIIFGFVFIIGVALAGYAVYLMFFSGESGSAQSNQPSATPDFRQQEEFYREQKIQKLESQLSAFRSEIEKAKLETSSLQKTLEEGKKKEEELKQELTRRDEWAGKNDGAIKKTQEDNLALFFLHSYVVILDPR